jgi:methionine-rich copper-binding protein CopC
MSKRKSRLCIGTLAVAALMALPIPASSHAGLVKSEPGRRAVLTTPPQQVRLCFNEKVEAKFSAVSMADDSGNAVAMGMPAMDPAEPRCLVTPVSGALWDGSYTVKYRVLSVDGHIVDYGYRFSLKVP